MSHPKRVKLFIPWAKAMVAGATVDKPNYSKIGSKAKTRRKRRRKRRKRHGKEK